MPKDLRMPTVAELPEGPRRDFVVEMFGYFRACNRPTLNVVGKLIQDHEELPGTASPETVRRILNGTRVPSWNTVESVFLVLCELAKINPDEDAYEATSYGGGYDEQPPNRREQLNRLWNEARDAPLEPAPQPRPLPEEPPF